MNVLVKLYSGLGSSMGATFSITTDVGGAAVPSTASLQELLDGVSVSVNNLATKIIVTSLGTCTDSLVLNISQPTTTSTTTSTTTTSTTTTSTTTTNAFKFYNAEVYDCTISTDCSLPNSYAVVKFPLATSVTIGEYYSLDTFVWFKLTSTASPNIASDLTGAISSITCPCSTTTTTTTTSTTTSTSTTSTTSTTTTSTTTTSTTTTSTTSTTTTTTTSTTTTTLGQCFQYKNFSPNEWVGDYQACDGTWYYGVTVGAGNFICAVNNTPFTIYGTDLAKQGACNI